MTERLTEILDPRTLPITLSDLAQGLGKSAEQVYFPTPKSDDERPEDAWKWASLFLMVVKGEGGRFGSYRALHCWMQAVIEMLENCTESQTLEELIFLTETELQKYRYRDVHKQRLREVLQREKARLHAMKSQAQRLEKAWEWARFWESVLSSCPDEASLNMLLQMYKAQQHQFEEYPQVLDWVVQVSRERRDALAR